MEYPSDTLEMQMVQVPAGTIALRDDRIGRTWSVNLQRFAIGRYPVTHAQYAAVTGQWPSSCVSAQCPVENVSWMDAIRFCNRLSTAGGLLACYEIHEDGTGASAVPGSNGYRLPTEAEWEYACRAGTNGPRYGDLDAIAWYRENSGGRTHEIGQKQPNDWGLHDTLGNVWEWCADQYDPEVYGAYRVFRGGGWADAERGCLATNRRRSHPTFAIDDLGFRVARSLDAGHA
ncbi:formylglycine-generating enzyme family protein [Burkholderia catarinensis]|uniref:formylglycine-generating enzyme family protein n=1 Tax=Burkholderia catarinensis TaxID=1108140 RepID=UPI001FEBFDD0|nr:formylglycine-generating enzyme family protein [Burkholderia catarinensis]KAG8152724.1 sulfatase-modifying factor protein [Burkholderia catarinensis]